jgi:ATP-dependent Lon protease
MMRISGTIFNIKELASVLQVCFDGGTKKILISITSVSEFGTVLADLIGTFSLIFYTPPQEVEFKTR